MRLFSSYGSTIGEKLAYNSALGITESQGDKWGLKKGGKPSKYQTTFIRESGEGAGETTIAIKFFPVKGTNGSHRSGIAIDFTPSKLSKVDWDTFRSMLDGIIGGGAQGVLEKFTVNRLELVVDVSVPMDELLCIAPGIETENLNYLVKGTRYLGQKGGKRTYCIYDKRKQIADKHAVDIGNDLTRVEVRLRYLGKRLEQLPQLKEPFADLVVLRKTALTKLCQQNPGDSLLVAFADAILGTESAHQFYCNLSKHHKKQLVERLRPAAVKLNPKHELWDPWINGHTKTILAHIGNPTG